MCVFQLNSSATSEVEAEEIDGDFFFEGDHVVVEDESDDEEDTESSVDLLIRFLQSMLKKVSKRAKKASRSVLPAQIPAQLVIVLYLNLDFSVGNTSYRKCELI